MKHDKMHSNLSAYKDDELDEGLTDQISRHLQACESCREELRELDQLDSLVRGLSGLDVSETFTLEILSKTHPAHVKTSLSRRILDRFLRLADSIFELLPGDEFERTGSLDEFGDFPPLSFSHAYFQVIGHSK